MLQLLSCYLQQFPAGLVDERECPEGAALRELREETGVTLKMYKFYFHY